MKPGGMSSCACVRFTGWEEMSKVRSCHGNGMFQG